jgi:PAS domain S-box-containing protein
LVDGETNAKMVSLADGFLLAGVLAGGVVLWFGYRTYRLPDQLGRRWFVAFTGVLGLGSLVTGVLGILPSLVPVDGRPAIWSELPILFWVLSTFPWFVFTLQYTGTRTRVRRRNVALIGVPYLLFFVRIGLNFFDIGSALLNVLAAVVVIYVILIAAGGIYLLLQTTYSAGHLSVGQGVSLSVAPIGSLTLWNAMGVATQSSGGDTSLAVSAGLFAAGAGVAAAGLGAAVARYDLFESVPSIDTLGERALTRETDDLMFVADDDDRIIRINETAVDALGVSRSEALGKRLAAVVDHDTGTLRHAETVQVPTTRGTRQYDPQVATVDDHHGNDLGATISLRDVTERELREQRLAVLNRVLRHNLRNEADVVKAHAENLEGEGSDVGAIIDAADSIAALGRQARRIDQYVSESPESVAVDLPEVVDRVLETIDAGTADVSVSVETPASARAVTNERALVSALESALDNAVTYADSTVTVTVENHPEGYVIRVVDDGPGIPEWELDSLETGTETALQHSTGIGLWQLKWAVMALNGQLSFDTDGGTVVEMVVPDRGGDGASA